MVTETNPLLGVFKYSGRDIFAYRMPSGEVQPFYRSLEGTGGKQKGKVYPFDGIAPDGWVIKDRYYRDSAGNLLDRSDENFGYADVDSVLLRRAAQDIEERAKRHGLELKDAQIVEANELLRGFGAVLDPRAA